MNAESKGRYLNSHIKGQYEATGYELKTKHIIFRFPFWELLFWDSLLPTPIVPGG